MYCILLEDSLPNEVYYVENLKSTQFFGAQTPKSTNLRIHELVIFNQTTKTDIHEEKYFHSIYNGNQLKIFIVPITISHRKKKRREREMMET